MLFLWQRFQFARREKRPLLYRWFLKKNQPGFDKTSNPGWLSAGKRTVRRRGEQSMHAHRNRRNKSKVFWPFWLQNRVRSALGELGRATGGFEAVLAEKIPISIDIPTFLRMSQLDLARALTENIVKNGYFQDIATGRNAAFMTGRSS